MNKYKIMVDMSESLMKKKHSGKNENVLKKVKHLYAAECNWFTALKESESFKNKVGRLSLVAALDNYNDVVPKHIQYNSSGAKQQAGKHIKNACANDWMTKNAPDFDVTAVLAGDMPDEPGDDEIQKLAGIYGQGPGFVWQIW